MFEMKFIHQCDGIEFESTFEINQTTKKVTIGNLVETASKTKVFFEKRTYPTIEEAIKSVCAQIKSQAQTTKV